MDHVDGSMGHLYGSMYPEDGLLGREVDQWVMESDQSIGYLSGSVGHVQGSVVLENGSTGREHGSVIEPIRCLL